MEYNISIPMERFGKDHWSLLAYIETCCVEGENGIGSINFYRMRCNIEQHPSLVGSYPTTRSWKREYGTVLRDGSIIDWHDDIHCLDDLERAGLIEIVSLANGLVKLTERGNKICSLLRTHKANGKKWVDFELPSEVTASDSI